ncbi:hypothetical protein JRT83AECX_JRT83AEC_04705 [Escherichia coli]|nr:hypothetical protein JRT83AECX_JRT83AEC_04705 [Escherichia coli]
MVAVAGHLVLQVGIQAMVVLLLGPLRLLLQVLGLGLTLIMAVLVAMWERQVERVMATLEIDMAVGLLGLLSWVMPLNGSPSEQYTVLVCKYLPTKKVIFVV